MKFFRHVSIGFVVFSLLIFANLALSEPQVVFTGWASGNSEIYLLKGIESKEPINLTQHPANDRRPCWSPDGKKIAFTSDRTGDEEIYIMDIETRKVERITYYSGYDGHPAWCPKGGRIAFTSDRDAGSSDIYIIDLLTKEIVRRTDHMLAGSLDWTPDGNKLAFCSGFGGKSAICLIDPYRDVLVSSPDECEVIVEQPPPGYVYLQEMSFSPDGTMVAFTSTKIVGGTRDVCTIDLSTGDFKNLTKPFPHHDDDPCWSPDGKFIAFSSSREGSIGRYDIYFMTPEGEIIEQLKFEGYDFNPDVFDPDFAYSVSPLIDSKACTWGEIKR